MIYKARLAIAAIVLVYGLTNKDAGKARTAGKRLATVGASFAAAILVDKLVDRLLPPEEEIAERIGDTDAQPAAA